MPDTSFLFKKIPLCDIVFPPDEMRTAVDLGALDELARSMRSQGLLNPISVKLTGLKFELIAGFRRTKAAEINGWTDIDAKIYPEDCDTMLLKKAHENMFREEVNPADEARYFKLVLEKEKWTLETLAAALHKSDSYVRRRLNIIAMPELLQDAIKDSKISVSVAEELMRFKDTAERDRLFWHCVNSGATVEIVRTWRVQSELAFNQAPAPMQEGERTNADGQVIDTTKPFNLAADPGPQISLTEQVKQFRVCHFCIQKVDVTEAKLIIACPVCAKNLEDALNKPQAV